MLPYVDAPPPTTGCGILPLLNTAVLLAFVPTAAWESHTAARVHTWAVRTLRVPLRVPFLRGSSSGTLRVPLRGSSSGTPCPTSSRRADVLGVLGSARAEEEEEALGEAAPDHASLLAPDTVQHETLGSHPLLPLPPLSPRPPLPRRCWLQIQLLRRAAAAAWSVGALWLMLAIVVVNASFLRLTG